MSRSIVAATTLLLLGSSCGFLAPRSDPTRLFVLATIEELEPERAPAPRDARELGIGPLDLPDYLRSELVSREGVTGLSSSRYERWAEPLDQAVARVLAADLAFLSGARPVPHPWYAADAPPMRVRILFERFELEGRAQVVLTATWSLESAGGRVLDERRTHLVRPLADRDGATAARELSRALAELSQEIATAWSAASGGGSE